MLSGQRQRRCSLCSKSGRRRMLPQRCLTFVLLNARAARQHLLCHGSMCALFINVKMWRALPFLGRVHGLGGINSVLAKEDWSFAVGLLNRLSPNRLQHDALTCFFFLHLLFFSVFSNYVLLFSQFFGIEGNIATARRVNTRNCYPRHICHLKPKRVLEPCKRNLFFPDLAHVLKYWHYDNLDEWSLLVSHAYRTGPMTGPVPQELLNTEKRSSMGW